MSAGKGSCDRRTGISLPIAIACLILLKVVYMFVQVGKLPRKKICRKW